ncbi:MAG: hypothetical protein K2X91_15120, partial [Thermoleophilia bacterium]|nr:hypothetical protein [Thermoleophilia bacterium]
GRRRARAWVFTGIVGGIALVGLVRLHATGGYCTFRHALIPGTFLTLAAGNAVAWILRNASIEGSRLGLGEGRLHAGPAVWTAAVVLLVAGPLAVRMKPYSSSFAPYRLAGIWLGARGDADGRILDLTDWSLYFSGRSGAGFPKVLEAVDDPATRFVVVQDAQLNGHLYHSGVIRRRIAGREPVARFPENPGPRQIRVSVYDLDAPAPGILAESERGDGGLVR